MAFTTQHNVPLDWAKAILVLRWRGLILARKFSLNQEISCKQGIHCTQELAVITAAVYSLGCKPKETINRPNLQPRSGDRNAPIRSKENREFLQRPYNEFPRHDVEFEPQHFPRSKMVDRCHRFAAFGIWQALDSLSLHPRLNDATHRFGAESKANLAQLPATDIDCFSVSETNRAAGENSGYPSSYDT